MSSLVTYRAKRDFTVTKEPRGRVARGVEKALRFVVQRHDATRLHFDFRLELDGVYKSWAVTKVPTLDPATKRLAVEVEDHPLDYGTFEGTIPEGQYGGGTVQLWDSGTWEPQGMDPRAALAKGHIKINMHGKRLKGGWALIRLKDRDVKPGRKVRHNWLLIKEKDEAAQPGEPEALSAYDTSVTTGRTLAEIAGAKKKNIWNSSARKAAAKQLAKAPSAAVQKILAKKKNPKAKSARAKR